MVAIEVSEIVFELLERVVRKSENHDSVQSLVDAVLTEYLMKHDRFGQLHVPFSTMLMTEADNIGAARKVIDTIDWYDTHDPIETALNHLRAAEDLLRDTAHRLAKEGK
ncbi:MAG: hypothetical protein K9W43_03855 [Candidatus Thorarchaeota archaeon]|nr:hypothetical protein [Candidatus Thorarchaeota archaeon]